MKKHIAFLLVSILLVSIVPLNLVDASSTTNATYSGVIRVTNNSTIAQYVSVPFSANTTQWINSELLNGNFDDVTIRSSGGSDIPHAPIYGTNLWILFCESIAALINQDYTLYLGASDVTSPRIFLNSTGMVTTDNDTSLELGGNFTISQTGLVDTAAGSGKSLFYKQNALSCNVSSTTSGNITTALATQFGSTLRYSSDAETNTAEVDYTLLKEISLTGEIYQATVKFDIKSGGGGGYGRVYKNDVAIGTEQSTSSTSYVTKSENITLSAMVGDKIQLYVHSGGGYQAYIQNFRIYYSQVAVSVAGISMDEHNVVTAADGTWLTLNIDSTPTFFVSDNIVLNVPLWLPSLNDPVSFLSIDPYTHNVTVYGYPSSMWKYYGRDLDGINDTIKVLHNNVFNFENTDDFTIALWINSTNTTNSRLFYKGAQLALQAPNTDGKIWFRVREDASNYSAYTGSTTVTSGTWHYIVVMRNGNILQLYLDGVLDPSPSISEAGTGESCNVSSSTDIYIGSEGGASNFWIGKIGESQIDSGAWSGAEVLQNYNATKDRYSGVTSSNYTYLLGASVPDNSNNITIWANLPYLVSSNITIGGTLRQSINWEYGSVFYDDSGNGNSAVPSFRTTSSDADVSAELISFGPVTQAQASSATTSWPTMADEPPDEPTGMYSEDSSPGIFFAPLVNTLLDFGNIPRSFFWYNFAFFVIIGSGIFVYYIFTKAKTQALLIKCVVMAAWMVVFALEGINIFGMYIVIYFVMWCFGVLVLSKSYGW